MAATTTNNENDKLRQASKKEAPRSINNKWGTHVISHFTYSSSLFSLGFGKIDFW